MLQQFPCLDQHVALRLAGITASRRGEVSQLSRKNPIIQRAGTVIVDRVANPKTAQLDPNRAARYLRIEGYGAQQLRRVLRPLRPDAPLPTMSDAMLLKCLRQFGCTKHSIKRGAIQHVATLMAQEEGPQDIRVLSQLAKHKNSLDAPGTTVGYAGATLGNLAPINRWVAKL
ncbi:hypothetical protein ABB37_02381 [Leptomonas pyrrhocoris]|uniref:Uncharacterized protein n=1 Tax=Leptomonas pyrrhocoris TaxID=157538 RepID=A0A0M9G851_LEPPY|nr:hypothetical protein ABB37_02381 [Leptomonas pyrrhocoris]XP_015662838.1 hypothetical protein ABB37_02381 [Leptomonas pyrrhocoris]KPA84398.1 hypothetical protein ABB37_02381 [Leptomonas pyrrhocoris]KPA84399.1 hypothetical protein ABB37_02381 [Leptomonas pyrrhocoris]|eukprot:XP_015662837.1 hypothetical protein ABB37_02381 [Leptomonas pyrrhocoris]